VTVATVEWPFVELGEMRSISKLFRYPLFVGWLCTDVSSKNRTFQSSLRGTDVYLNDVNCAIITNA
jgi:hypothetical protein